MEESGQAAGIFMIFTLLQGLERRREGRRHTAFCSPLIHAEAKQLNVRKMCYKKKKKTMIERKISNSNSSDYLVVGLILEPHVGSFSSFTPALVMKSSSTLTGLIDKADLIQLT